MHRYIHPLLAFSIAFGAIACQTGTPGGHGRSPRPETSEEAQVPAEGAGRTCGQVLTIARDAMREALKHEKDALPVVGLDDDRFWVIQTDIQAPSNWRVGWGGNPAGGGFHGTVIIDKASGKVASVYIGSHLR